MKKLIALVALAIVGCTYTGHTATEPELYQAPIDGTFVADTITTVDTATIHYDAVTVDTVIQTADITLDEVVIHSNIYLEEVIITSNHHITLDEFVVGG